MIRGLLRMMSRLRFRRPSFRFTFRSGGGGGWYSPSSDRFGRAARELSRSSRDLSESAREVAGDLRGVSRAAENAASAFGGLRVAALRFAAALRMRQIHGGRVRYGRGPGVTIHVEVEPLFFRVLGFDFNITPLLVGYIGRELSGPNGIRRLRQAVPAQTGELRNSIGATLKGGRVFEIGSLRPVAHHAIYKRDHDYGAHKFEHTLTGWRDQALRGMVKRSQNRAMKLVRSRRATL